MGDNVMLCTVCNALYNQSWWGMLPVELDVSHSLCTGERQSARTNIWPDDPSPCSTNTKFRSIIVAGSSFVFYLQSRGTKPRKTITVTLPRPSLHQQYQISAKRLMRMCNNRLLDLQDTSLEVTPDTAGNISSQSFLLNLQYSLRVTFNILTSSPGDAAPTQRPYSHRIIGSSM